MKQLYKMNENSKSKFIATTYVSPETKKTLLFKIKRKLEKLKYKINLKFHRRQHH